MLGVACGYSSYPSRGQDGWQELESQSQNQPRGSPHSGFSGVASLAGPAGGAVAAAGPGGWALKLTAFQSGPALEPALRELLHHALDLLDLAHVDAEQGNAGGGEEGIHEHVALLAVLPLVAVVVQLDAEHGHPVFIAADEEVDVLLRDLGEGGAVVFLVLEDIGQPGLHLNAAAVLGNLLQAGVKTSLGMRE